MPTRRCILKNTPIVLLVLFALSWVVSFFGAFGIRADLGDYGRVILSFTRQFAVLAWLDADGHQEVGIEPNLQWFRRPILIAGRLQWHWADDTKILHFPIPLLMTLLLPLAIGPHVAFRFRLWHYLAYTAIVCMELAYYVQRQWVDGIIALLL